MQSEFMCSVPRTPFAYCIVAEMTFGTCTSYAWPKPGAPMRVLTRSGSFVAVNAATDRTGPRMAASAVR